MQCINKEVIALFLLPLSVCLWPFAQYDVYIFTLSSARKKKNLETTVKIDIFKLFFFHVFLKNLKQCTLISLVLPAFEQLVALNLS